MVFRRRKIAKQGRFSRRPSRNEGSVLILILWVLVLLGFLSGEYLSHNRGNAALAYNAWHNLKLEESIQSVVALIASGYGPNKAGSAGLGGWGPLSVKDVKLWVKVDSESTKTNINKASDAEIRGQVQKSFGEEMTDEADEITDAILDWRDADDLVRVHGGEADYYTGLGLPYRPANGPFKVLTEMLLVKGISPSLFWGDPLGQILNKGKEGDVEHPESLPPLVDDFTIYPENVKRLSIIAPGRGKSYTLVLIFLKSQGGRWVPFGQCRSALLESHPSANETGKNS
jgi:DNA uptake protein ComE-like DNA-binding protein